MEEMKMPKPPTPKPRTLGKRVEPKEEPMQYIEARIAPETETEIETEQIPTPAGRVLLPKDVTEEPAKWDETKLARFDLVPSDALWLIAEIFGYGSNKYGPRNWESGHGFRYGRLYAAAQRHQWAWLNGEDTDPESGMPHLAHACCTLMMLLATQTRGMGEDDRWEQE